MQTDPARTRALCKRHASLLEHALDGVCFVDRAGTVLASNDLARDLLGEVDGSRLLDHLPASIAPQIGEAMSRVAAGGPRESHGALVRTPGGGERAVHLTLSWLSAEDCLLAQLRATAPADVVDQMIAGVAHDLNNILMVVVGHAELAIEDLADGPPLESLRVIARVAARARVLTGQLLTASSRDLARPVVLDVNRVVADNEMLLRAVLGGNIDLEVRLAPDLGPVRADPRHIAQVLLNLGLNARDAMSCGGTLTVETANAVLDAAFAEQTGPVRPGRYTLLSISDSGSGMDARTRARVSEPGFTTKDHKGTGLGLAIVHSVVRESGGYIWLFSDPGVGTAFKIYLPRLPGPGEDDGARTAGPRAPSGREDVLLVDDDDAVRVLVERILTAHGYRVTVAGGVGEAARIINDDSRNIDLLLTDLILEPGHGAALARELVLRRPGSRVLYMSGYPVMGAPRVRPDPDVPDAPVMQKPFTSEELLSSVRQALAERVKD